MKTKKIKKYNLINYNLLKSRNYLGLHKLSFYYLNSSYIIGFRNNLSVFNLKQTKNFIKKSLLLIYKFHYYNKKILFIGFPNLLNKNYNILFNKTNHYFISYDMWIHNFFVNFKKIMFLKKKLLLLKKNLSSKELKTIINIDKIPDLIVVYNQTKETKIIEEILSTKIPFISFMNSSINSNLFEYKILGGFHHFKAKIFIYLLLKSILTLSRKKIIKKKEIVKKKKKSILMRIIKNTIYKPFYKNLIRLNNNVQARLKFLFFEKKKWKDLISFENNKKKNVILFDHTIYLRPRYGFKFENKFKFYLNLRQKLKFFYGKLSDKKFKNIYYKSKNKNIVKINKFFNKNSFSILFFLESRLDVILYRTLFFDSIRSSQQAIYHGKIFVNGKKISINSYLTKKGDLIQIDYSFHKVILKNEAYYQNCRIIVPKYLEINYRTFQFFIVSDISLSKISSNFPFWLNINKLFLLNH